MANYSWQPHNVLSLKTTKSTFRPNACVGTQGTQAHHQHEASHWDVPRLTFPQLMPAATIGACFVSPLDRSCFRWFPQIDEIREQLVIFWVAWQISGFIGGDGDVEFALRGYRRQVFHRAALLSLGIRQSRDSC